MLQADGPVIIMGDFNAHISTVIYPRENKSSNIQGDLLLSMMTRTDHYAVSLCPPYCCPNYTYLSGGISTTMDYCLINCWAAHLVSSCEVITKHPLNLSDHLPIQIVLYCSPDHLLPYTRSTPKLNWRKAVKDGSVLILQSFISSFISPLLSTPLSTTDEVNSEISSVASSLSLTALEIIPKFRQKRKTKLYIHADDITQKCQTSKQAWKLWRDAGHPRAGTLFLFNSMKNAKYEVKSYIRSLRAKQERR